VQNRIAALGERPPAGLNPGLPATGSIDVAYEDLPGAGGYCPPAPSAGAEPIGGPAAPGRAVAEGRIRVMAIRPGEDETVLPAEISDSAGNLTALFHGRDRIAGLACGGKVRLRGQVDVSESSPAAPAGTSTELESGNLPPRCGQ
jgi:hypothetical protein